MKKLFLLLTVSLLVGCTGPGGHNPNAVVTFRDLPQPAQEFIQKHYDTARIKEIVREKRASLIQYTVDMKGGIDIQFDHNGVCTELSSSKSPVPDDLIPGAIRQQISERFPGRTIVKYEHDDRLYDIDLDDGTKLAFNRSLRLIDIDVDD